MDSLKISAVSYLNTFPFVFGIRQSGILENVRLDLDVPSVCAEKFKSGQVDLALVPVGALPDIGKYHIIGDYCIGAISSVKTVLLLSRKPLDDIQRIHLDPDSRTSVELAQLLARNYWKIRPEWIHLAPGQADRPEQYESLVAIGDKTFELAKKYEFIYDLADEWIKFSFLPFVFAIWVSKEKPERRLARKFNRVLAYGVNHKTESVEYFKDKLPAGVDAIKYLNENISFEFDKQKKRGLDLFLTFLMARYDPK